MKRVFIVLLTVMALLLSACSGQDISAAVSGKTFTWEKEGFGGDFTITRNEDGSYRYYEGFLSSYIGSGDWSVKNDMVVMTEKGGYDTVFRFSVKDGDLIYRSDGSDRFIYTAVEDGDRFRQTDSLPETEP